MKTMKQLIAVAIAAFGVIGAFADVASNLLVNASFEDPQNSSRFYEFHESGAEGLGWRTLALDGQIEFGSTREVYGAYARSSYGATRAWDGYQFAELSANAVGALYQKVKTTPGKTYRWSWARKARFGTEASAFWTLSPEKFAEAKELYLQYLRGEQPLSVIRPAVQALTNEHFVCTHADVELSGDTSTWTRYDGAYTVPNGQMETYVVLVEWNKNPEDSQGCLVDAVSFGEEVFVQRGTFEAYNVKGGAATVSVPGDSVTLEGEGYAYDFFATNVIVNVTSVADPGYTFLGAFVSGYTNTTDVFLQGTEFILPSELAAYRMRAGSQRLALAYGKDCTVSYLPNGGVPGRVCEQAETTLAKSAGSSCVPSVPTRDGYVFQGWRERTSLKMLRKNWQISWKNDRLIAQAEDGEYVSVPASDGMQLLACWTRNNDVLPDGSIEFTDGFGENSSYPLKRNESMDVSDNPKFEHQEGFVEYELVGWRLPSFNRMLSTNVTAVYLGVPNEAKDGATDGVIKFMDAEGHALSITNCPGVLLEAIWKPKHTYEWAVLDTTIDGGAAKYFDRLSEALAALKSGYTLFARPPAEGFGFGEGLKPDTNDVLTVDCLFAITTDNVTVDLNGRVLNSTVDGNAGDYLMTVVSAKGVTIRNGYLLGVKESFEYKRIGPQACRGIKVDNLAEVYIEDADLQYSPYAEAVLVDRQSKLSFVNCYLDAEGDGAEAVVCARKGSVLSLKDCKGLWNEDDFWDNSHLDGSLDNLTGEQFVIDSSTLVLDNTVVCNNSKLATIITPHPYIVETRGTSTITLLNGGSISENNRGATQGTLHVVSGVCTIGNGRDEGLRFSDCLVKGGLVVEEDATLVAGAAKYSDDPTEYLPENATAVQTDGGWLVVVSSGSKVRDQLEYVIGASGIENINVNKFVPFPEDYPYSQYIAGNMSMWLKMTEGGVARNSYLAFHLRSMELGVDYVISNSVPDALFPTNTVIAHVWRSPGTALTNAYGLLATDVAKTIIDPEVVNLLTNFSPLVESVTRGAGSATIPYVDADGHERFGKAVILGCKPGDWTAYDIVVNELKKIGDGYEAAPYSETRRYIVTNSTMKILGSRNPSVAFGSLGYLIISSSEEVWKAVEQATVAYVLTGKKPFYDTRRAVAAAYDAELKRIDPDYASYGRNFKTDGFERFGYAYLSAMYQPALAKALEDIGINPALAGTNRIFRYTATLCSEECTAENDRMRIDIHGNEATVRAIGASLYFSDKLFENAGIVDEDFMTFDEAWKFDPEVLAKISEWTSAARERLGLNGVDYYFKESDDRTTVFADVGYVPGKKFEQLFCAGKAGGVEENPCQNCLPSNTVAGFVFQPSAAAWAELNERLLAQFGQDREVLKQVCAAFRSHPNSFGKSAAIGIILGSDVKTFGPNDELSGSLGLVSSVKIEDENLWISLRILLEQFGCKTRVGEIFPSVTVCEFTNSTFSVAYDRDYKIVEFATKRGFGHAASVARRNKEARLISSSNKVFNDRMGIDVEAGETPPDYNTLFYFAPECDNVLHTTLEEYLGSVGLGALTYLSGHDELSGVWACGTGKADAEKGVFFANSYISKEVWDRSHWLFEATAKTLGQIAAAAFPYDASKARVFTFGKMTLNVSRADNWDDVNDCLYDYSGDNIRFRYQGVTSDGKTVDKTFSGRLESDGFFHVGDDTLFDRGYLTSEGIFTEYKRLTTGYYIAREAPEIEPELSVLPSAEEIAAQLKQVKDAIGIESVTVGAAKSDELTGPFGEDTVVRETTIVPTPGGGLDKLIAMEPYAGKTRLDGYMLSNTVFGTQLRCADGSLTNIIAALRYVQPELIEYMETLFGGFGIMGDQLGAAFNDGLVLGIAKEELGLEPYIAARLNRGQYQQWTGLTNRLYTATGVTVMDFQTSKEPGVWEAIAFTRTDPDTGRVTSRSYTRIFESEDRDPFFIITKSTELNSGIMDRVRRAGLYGEGRLVDDPTFRACAIPWIESYQKSRGFTYLAPIADKYWFHDLLVLNEDGELVIQHRTSAAAAPYEATIARFAVNFFEVLRGEKTVVTFENDPEVDKTAEAATERVIQAIRQMRTRLGVTGLDFYDAEPDEDGRYGNSELAIGTKGDDCEFLRRFAADDPASEHLVESYIPATACAMAKGNGEPGFLSDGADASLKALAELLGEKYPEVAEAITNFLASDTWKVSAESMLLTGTHKAMAVLQDLEHPFVKDIGGGSYASISAGYSVFTVFGPMDSSLPFLLLRQALVAKGRWEAFEQDGIEYLVHDGQFDGRDLSQFLTPTFAYDAANKVMVSATSLEAAQAAIAAGVKGENRLLDTDTFFDVTGFEKGEMMPEHNTLVYLAPQNDDILGCTLRRVLSPYLPESYAMLLDRPSLKGYWGAAYGLRVGDAFRIYTHAGIKGHTAFLAAGQALLKTVAEAIRVRRPYEWTEPKVFRSADRIFFIEPTEEDEEYAVSIHSADGEFDMAEFLNASSDNQCSHLGVERARIMSSNCVFVSIKGGVRLDDAGRNLFRLMFIDEEADPSDYTGGVAVALDAREQTFPVGEMVEQQLRIYPADAKVTKVTGLPKGLSLEESEEGYILTGTPTEIGEDCIVEITSACAGRQTSRYDFHFIAGNYRSDYAELEEHYDNFAAGVEGRLELPQVAGWDVVDLPLGLTFDKKTGTISGKAVAKSGTTIIYFFKEVEGRFECVSTILDIAVGDLELAVDDAVDGVLSVYAGVRLGQKIAVKGLEGVDNLLVAEGLPDGLKLTRVNNDYQIEGVVREAVESEVTVKAVNGYGWKGSMTFTLSVKPLPAWAVGKFYGNVTKTTGEVLADGEYEVFGDGRIEGVISSGTTVTRLATRYLERYDSLNECFCFSGAIDGEEGAVKFTGAVGKDKNALGQTSGRLIFAYDIGEYLCVCQAEQEPGEVPFPASRIGVCSWSWATNLTGVLDLMDQSGVKCMSLALMSWLKPSDGTKYEGPFGYPETAEMFESISNMIATGEISVPSTMLSFPHERWDSYESISNTCGIMYTDDPTDPIGAKAWTVHSNLVEQAAVLTKKLGVEYITCFVGFLMKPIMFGGINVNANGQLGLERLHAAHELCAKYGVKLLLESGHYSGEETMNILAAYEAKYGASEFPLTINFDAANHLAYGNDTPRIAYDAMKSRIGQIHIKDACEGTTTGGFAVDVKWGTGDVSGKYDLLGYLREQGYTGNLLVECEAGAGEERIVNIKAALKAILIANNDDPEDQWISPQAMEGDTAGEKCEAALKAQGFSDDVAKALADAELYGLFRDWADDHDLDPDGLAAKSGVILASAFDAPAVADPTSVVMTIDDLAVGTDRMASTEMTLEDFKSVTSGTANGKMTFVVSVTAKGYDGPINEKLIKAALGVEGTTSLGDEVFSPDMLDFEFGKPQDGKIPVKVQPKKVWDETPPTFFIRVKAR